MNFKSELISGLLIKRYKRFFADIKIKNQIVTAHCPNTGSMQGLLNAGNKVWISKTDKPNRKLKYTLEIIESGKSKVGVNTHSSNKIVYHALKNRLINGFNNFLEIKPESKFGENTRFDFLLDNGKSKCFIEVKNVTLVRNRNLAEFPDAITSRGKKHLKELIKATYLGYKSYMLYVIQREDCNSFAIAKDIDPEYLEILSTSIKKKVKILCYDCKFSSKGIKLNKKIKLQINE